MDVQSSARRGSYYMSPALYKHKPGGPFVVLIGNYRTHRVRVLNNDQAVANRTCSERKRLHKPRSHGNNRE